MREDIIKLANAADCNSYEALREQYPLPPAQLDGRVYTDPTLYAAERKRIFLESWFPACPQSDIPNPGDYTTWERLDQSVIIIRQEDGTISAWHNVCLHRGAKLVAGSGSAKGGLITCPWHGFSYSTAGELSRIPLADTFDSSAIANRRCQAVRMESWGGYCWLTFSDSQKPLTQYLGGDFTTNLVITTSTHSLLPIGRLSLLMQTGKRRSMRLMKPGMFRLPTAIRLAGLCAGKRPEYELIRHIPG